MGRIRRLLGLIPAVFFGVAAWMTQVSPDEAVANACKWIAAFGRACPEWISVAYIPAWAPYLLLTIAVSTFIWAIWPFVISLVRKRDPLDGTILVECIDAGLPTVIPTSGNLFHVGLHPMARIAQLGRFVLPVGAPVNWGLKSVASVRCEVKNFSKTAIANLEITFKVSFYQNLKSGSGDLVKEEDQPIMIPALRENALETFEFYIYNSSNLYITLYLPTEASALIVGQKKRQSVKLMKPTFYRGIPLHPVELDGPKPSIITDLSRVTR